MRKSRVVLIVGAILALVIGVIFVGGSVLACLGPLGVTHVQCIAAFNAVNDPDYAPGPASGAWIPVACAALLMAIAIAPWRRPSTRAIIALAAASLAGAFVGSVAYDLTRETSLTGPTSSGEIITVAFGPSTEARLMAGAIGAGIAACTGALASAVTARRRNPGRPQALADA